MISVRRHVRRGKPPGFAKPAAAAVAGPHWHAHPPSFKGSLGAVIDDVVAERRKGYTWTRKYRFDVDDSVSMTRLYDQIGGSIMYVIARTNQTLSQWETRVRARDPSATTIADNVGIGVWRDDDGTIYVDEISVLRFNESHDADAIRFGRIHHQKYILKVDGNTRSFEFIPTGSLVGQV
jgi:hypothetical protein